LPGEFKLFIDPGGGFAVLVPGCPGHFCPLNRLQVRQRQARLQETLLVGDNNRMDVMGVADSGINV
jgi:hypothetical protein